MTINQFKQKYTIEKPNMVLSIKPDINPRAMVKDVERMVEEAEKNKVKEYKQLIQFMLDVVDIATVIIFIGVIIFVLMAIIGYILLPAAKFIFGL